MEVSYILCLELNKTMPLYGNHVPLWITLCFAFVYQSVIEISSVQSERAIYIYKILLVSIYPRKKLFMSSTVQRKDPQIFRVLHLDKLHKFKNFIWKVFKEFLGHFTCACSTLLGYRFVVSCEMSLKFKIKLARKKY